MTSRNGDQTERMSHLFISYAHPDKPHLDRLVAWLREHGFAEHEIWFDKHIEGGNNWRDEISAALNEAFAVLVIVTASSAKSLYCTFEWAYAMGQGIPTVPLVFDAVSLADVPAPLASKQFTNCVEHIPDYLQEQVRRLKSVPPQVAAINKLVYEAIYDTHRRFFILGWLGQQLEYLDHDLKESVMTYFVRKATEAYQTLQTLITEKSFVFSGRQYRSCWQLIDFLQEFLQLREKYDGYFQERLFPKFDSTWLPAFEYFEGNGWWSRWVRLYFESDLESEHARMQVLTEIVRVFPMFQGDDADRYIHNKVADQKPK